MPTTPPAPNRTDCSNVALWLGLAATVLATDGAFLIGLHRRLGYDVLFAIAGLLARTSVVVAVGMLFESLLMRAHEGYLTLTKTRRSVLHAYWVCVMLLCVALAVDLVILAFAGYHLHTAVRILFSDGPAGVGQVVEA